MAFERRTPRPHCELRGERRGDRQRAVREALHDRVRDTRILLMHRPLKFHEAVHERHAVLHVELHLVGRVAVPRLLDGHVRRAVED